MKLKTIGIIGLIVFSQYFLYKHDWCMYYITVVEVLLVITGR